MLKRVATRIVTVFVVALVCGAASALAAPIVFTDRAEFYAAIGHYSVATFDVPQACQQVRFSCSITEGGIVFSVFAELVPNGSIIVDHLQTTQGSAVSASFPAGTTAVGFDVDFPAGVGARATFSPSIEPFDIVAPGFFGIVSADSAITNVLWNRLNCCEGDIHIDNVAVSTVPEATSLELFGGAAMMLLTLGRRTFDARS